MTMSIDAMMRKTCILLTLWGLVGLCALAQEGENNSRRQVLLETTMGNIRIALANETPLHRDNFLKLVREHVYDSVLFHRVIKDFMIQTGDWATRYEKKDKRMKEMKGNFKYRIPAEIRFPTLFHKRGAVAAAREPDSENPKWESSPTQFYIVYGWDMNEAEVELYQHKIDSLSGGKIVFTTEIRETYVRQGGSPHLDGKYTVFGEVIEGMDVVEKIQSVETDEADQPKKDIRIIRAIEIPASN